MNIEDLLIILLSYISDLSPLHFYYHLIVQKPITSHPIYYQVCSLLSV